MRNNISFKVWDEIIYLFPWFVENGGFIVCDRWSHEIKGGTIIGGS